MQDWKLDPKKLLMCMSDHCKRRMTKKFSAVYIQLDFFFLVDMYDPCLSSHNGWNFLIRPKIMIEHDWNKIQLANNIHSLVRNDED